MKVGCSDRALGQLDAQLKLILLERGRPIALIALARGASACAERLPERACSCRFPRDYGAPFPEGAPLTSVYSRVDGVVL